MKYLVIDAELSGTGIRDKYEGIYLLPESLGLSCNIITRLHKWLLRYEAEHYRSYSDNDIIVELDQEGKEIALLVKKELLEVKLEYCSAAYLTSEMI